MRQLMHPASPFLFVYNDVRVSHVFHVGVFYLRSKPFFDNVSRLSVFLLSSPLYGTDSCGMAEGVGFILKLFDDNFLPTFCIYKV